MLGKGWQKLVLAGILVAVVHCALTIAVSLHLGSISGKAVAAMLRDDPDALHAHVDSLLAEIRPWRNADYLLSLPLRPVTRLLDLHALKDVHARKYLARTLPTGSRTVRMYVTSTVLAFLNSLVFAAILMKVYALVHLAKTPRKKE